MGSEAQLPGRYACAGCEWWFIPPKLYAVPGVGPTCGECWDAIVYGEPERVSTGNEAMDALYDCAFLDHEPEFIREEQTVEATGQLGDVLILFCRICETKTEILEVA